MAYYERGDLREKIKIYLDNRTDIDQLVNQWIDDTRLDLANTYFFSYLYTEKTILTTGGVSRYDLPSDYLGHLDIMLEDKKLVRVGAEEFDTLKGALKQSSLDGHIPFLETSSGSVVGDPDYYIDRGLSFEVFPVPDGSYTLTIRYYSQPHPFTSDTDYDYLTMFHPQAIVFGSALLGAIYLEDRDKIGIYEVKYTQAIEKMIKQEKDRKSTDIVRRIRTPEEFTPSYLRRIIKLGKSGV